MRNRDYAQDTFFTAELRASLLKPKVLMIAAGVLISAFTVSNALFLQNGDHPASLFAMRDKPLDGHALRADEMNGTNDDGRNITRIVFQGQQINKTDRLTSEATDIAVQQLPPPTPAIAQRPQQNDPMAVNNGSVQQLQQLLSQLGFYEGKVDGKTGPMTSMAIVNYKTSAGLQGIDLSTDQLITSARNNLLVTAAIPARRPDTVVPRKTKTVTYVAPSATTAEQPLAQPLPMRNLASTETVSQVQQALRDYAGDHIVVDGVMGSQTSKAIAEFQSVFRMKITGEIDTALIERMVDVGMIDS